MKINIERIAVPMFSIGLLSLVLGVFMMNNTPTFGAVKPVATPQLATQSITLNYLGWNDGNGGSACGYLGGNIISSGYQTEQSLAVISNFDSRTLSGDSLKVTKCQVTFKVLK
jgi:hypothetical protein